MAVFLLTVFISIFMCSLSQDCPNIYRRFSKEHTFCKPPNLSCSIISSGVTDADRKVIVETHNKLRSKVATGAETQAGHLPQATNMMQMVYDYELERVAQKLTEQCAFKHDCDECRRVQNFPVGQNGLSGTGSCSGGGECSPTPDWKGAVESWYSEVQFFDKQYVDGSAFSDSFGHFTQVIWAKSWRVGCGYTAYKSGNNYKTLLFCNYGPGGNTQGAPVYAEGNQCSGCPLNSCCGESCSDSGDKYEGLCRMNKDEAPKYPLAKNYVFYCNFSSLEGDCAASVSGKPWNFIGSLGGAYAEIVLSGGDSSTLQMEKTLRPKQKSCYTFKYRSGPAVAGEKSLSDAIASFERTNSNPVSFDLIKSVSQYTIILGFTQDTKISVTFKVPSGAPDQYFNLNSIEVTESVNGKC